MKIKTKLTLGVGLLFILIILLGVVGTVYINVLKADTANILEANYNSLQYSKNMLSSIDENSEISRQKFKVNLVKQIKNVTEIGEEEATTELKTYFNKFKQNSSDSTLQPILRAKIYRIMELNMDALQRKADLAQKTAATATFWIAFTDTLCFLIAFVLLINLPSNIANPIKELTASIKNIAAKKYSERVRFEKHNEFGDLARSFNVMAIKLEEYNNSNLAKIMFEKKRIETLMDNIHDPVIGLDSDFAINFINDEAIKIVGVDASELIGVSAKKIALSNDLLRKLIQDLLTETKDQSKQIKIYANNKESYFEKEILEIAITPTGEEEKQIIGYFIVLRNITEYKELDLAKTSFIATVSHEFKTPISAIKMSLQLLENEQIGTLNEEQQNLIQSVNEDADRLLRITGELLNITQVESGNIQLSLIPTNPIEVINYAIASTKTQAEKKQITLQTEIEENVPLFLADLEKTSWVLTNLISNAIRYSHERSIIEIKVKTSDEFLIFSVKDFGQGIAPQYKDKIFDRYFRIPGTQKEGTGLGLSISKEFIEAQGGIICLESDYGSGSTFSVKMMPIKHD